MKAVKFTLLPDAGTITENGVALTVNQLVSVADIGSGNLVFTPLVNLQGPRFFLCKFEVQDNGGTVNGGVDIDPTAKILDISIVSVNDSPIGTSNTLSMLKNSSLTLSAVDFGFSDLNDRPANSLSRVKIATLPVLGSLTDNGVTVTSGQLISAADINAGMLKYTPKAHRIGTATFTFQMQDNGGTAHGGIDTDPTPRQITISVNRPFRQRGRH